MPPFAQRQPRGHRLFYPLHRIVGIHQQDAVVGLGGRVGGEGFGLVRKGHHPAVGVGTTHGDAVVAPRPDVRRGVAAPNVSRPAGRQPTVDALRAPQPEFQHRILPGGGLDAGGLRGDEGAEVDDGQQRRLQQLRLDQRCLDAQQRHVRKDHLPLRQRVDGARKLHPLQVVQERLPEQRLTVSSLEPTQILNVLHSKPKVLDQVDHQRQSGSQRELTPERRLAVEKVKHGGALVHPPVVISGGHRELIKVGQQTKRRTVNLRQVRHR